ncbi:MAG TPA: outer membrane protein assembly factor BamC [Casimicrobiaceae bacterium]|nr:outer membrane protein assembly factor BamC [Casimicrobiaceae bacterium]
MNAVNSILPRLALLVAGVPLTMLLAGCETLGITEGLGKRIDYKTTGRAPSLEVPPDLTTPRFDDRFTPSTASGVAAQQGGPRKSEVLPQNPDARIVRAGSERWLVVKATPDQAWSQVRQFWTELGFVVAVEQPTIGVMETDWAENRAEMPYDPVRNLLGKVADVLYTTYKRDKFRTRVERGADGNSVEIYISHRGMEQVPTTKIDGSTPAAFAWAVLPPNPELEAVMLSRMMQRFGAPEAVATAAAKSAIVAPGVATPSDRARLEKSTDGSSKLVVDDAFDRAWRRIGLALDRTGFTVVDRDRSNGVYFVRYADPDSDVTKAREASGFLSKLMFWKADEKDRPEQYQIKVVETSPMSTVTVQDPKGVPLRTSNGERILALLREQLR